MSRRKYTAEERRRAVATASEAGTRAAARMLKIPAATISSWVQAAKPKPASATAALVDPLELPPGLSARERKQHRLQHSAAMTLRHLQLAEEDRSWTAVARLGDRYDRVSGELEDLAAQVEAEGTAAEVAQVAGMPDGEIVRELADLLAGLPEETRAQIVGQVH